MKKYKMNKEIKKVFDKMDPDVQASIKVLINELMVEKVKRGHNIS